MTQNIKLILVIHKQFKKYLKDHGSIESFLTLQRQSGIVLFNYSKEIQFFKDILIKGDFIEAVNFIMTFQNRIDEKDFKKIVLDIYKQKLYQLIQNPNEEELKNIFQKELVNYSTEQQFQELFNYLTFKSVNEIQGLQKWTVIKGRYDCFERIIPYLQMFNSVLEVKQVEQNLDSIIEFYNKNKNKVGYTEKQHRQTDNFKQTFRKVKPDITQQYESQEAKANRSKDNLLNNDQKKLVKSNVIKMNLNNNYSSIKNKNVQESSIITTIKKEQPISQQEIKKDKINPIKQNNLTENNHSNMSNVNSNISNLEKRPRVNASLTGPMNRQKLEQSVKMDNYIKEQPKYQQNVQLSMKKSNLSEKYQMPNQSNITNKSNVNPSNLSKSNINQSQYQQSYNLKNSNLNQSKASISSQYSKKPDNKSTYLINQDNSNLLNPYNNLQSSQLNEISEQEITESAKSIKVEKNRPNYGYLNNNDQDLQQQIKKNIEYLQQTNSIVYNKSQIDPQQFTFQDKTEQRQEDFDKIQMITKLAIISDNKAIRTCKFSQSGNHFAVGTNSSILKIFDVEKLFEKNKLNQILPIYQIDNLHQKSIFCLDWSKNQRNIITCSNDMNIKLSQINHQFNDHKTSVIGKHDSCIRMVKYSQNETKILSCGDDSVIKVWDIGKIKKCTNLKGHTNSVSSIKLHNQNDLYSVSKDMTIKRWDLRINENVITSKPQDSQLTYIANNTDKIVVSHKNGCVSFLTESLQLAHSVQIHQEEIRSIEALKGQNLYLTASFDGYLAIFSQLNCHLPNYFQHNDSADDKVVYANFLHSQRYKGFSSTSTQGLCHIYSYQ